MSCSIYSEGHSAMPTQSHFMWFKAASKKIKLKQSKSAKLIVEHGTQIKVEEEIKTSLSKCESVSNRYFDNSYC